MLYDQAEQVSDDSGPTTLQSPEPSTARQAPSAVAATFASWLHSNRSLHLRSLRSRLPTMEDAEDALQDATLKLIQHVDALGRIEKPEAWVGVSLRHTVIDRYRRAAAQRRLAEALLAEPQDSLEPAEDERLTPAACLKSKLPSLKPEYGSLLRQVYLEGVSLKDIANRLRLTVNNVTVRLHRARNALRQAMRRQCGTCPLRADCWARRRLNSTGSA